MERGIRRTYTWFYLPDDVFFEPVLKAYEGPDKFFLHNVNATDPKISCKLVLIAMCSSSPQGGSPKGSALKSREAR